MYTIVARSGVCNRIERVSSLPYLGHDNSRCSQQMPHSCALLDVVDAITNAYEQECHQYKLVGTCLDARLWHSMEIQADKPRTGSQKMTQVLYVSNFDNLHGAVHFLPENRVLALVGPSDIAE